MGSPYTVIETCILVNEVEFPDSALSHQYFSVKLLPNMGAESFNKEQKVSYKKKLPRNVHVRVSYYSTHCSHYTQFYIDPMKLLPLMRFLPRPKTPGERERVCMVTI